MLVKGSNTGSSSRPASRPSILLVSLYLYKHGHVISVKKIGNSNFIIELVDTVYYYKVYNPGGS